MFMRLRPLASVPALCILKTKQVMITLTLFYGQHFVRMAAALKTVDCFWSINEWFLSRWLSFLSGGCIVYGLLCCKALSLKAGKMYYYY